MFKAPDSKYLVPFDGSFSVAAAATTPAVADEEKDRLRLKRANKQMDKLQRILMAGDRHSILLVFQAMDAAGKDSTIRAVMQGISPAGCEVNSFGRPSDLELDHDFLWRSSVRLPQRGRIGIFNRSYYEEVLVVRVHPEILESQKLPNSLNMETIWSERLESICDQEKHLSRNGTVILKFWLNVSRETQKSRLLARLNDPDKNWKFEFGDLVERRYWDDYMNAYEHAMNATSTPSAPWYPIPADDKPYMRATIAELIVDAMTSIGLRYPEADPDDEVRFDEARRELKSSNEP
jgi:PPK2 family polyphosphate:nucleotide phosphotransferase